MTRRVLYVAQPIVEPNGTMSAPFQEWTAVTTLLHPLTGSGSPETVVEGEQYQHYYDTTAAAGSIHYIKMLADIGGDKTQGWKLA